MKDRLIARWRDFSIKERSLLTILFLVVICSLIYAFIWLPVQHDRERLNRAIPEKKAKLLLMRSQAADIERLRGQFSTLRSQTGGLKAAIEVSAKVSGLTLNYAPTDQNTGDNRLKVALMQVSFDTWLKWVESLQSQHHVRVQSCQITPSASRGLVNIDAVFTPME